MPFMINLNITMLNNSSSLMNEDTEKNIVMSEES